MENMLPTARNVAFTGKKHSMLQVIVMNRNKRNFKKAKAPVNIGQLNINGVSNHFHIALERFMDVNNISLMALQETKITKDKIASFKMSGGMQHFFSPMTKDKSGVGLLIHSMLQPQRVKELEEEELDLVWCMAKVGSLNTLVASVYCPPINEDVGTLKKILSNMDNALKYGERNGIRNMLVLGDFNSRNINWCDIKTNNRGRVLLKHVNDTDYYLFTPVEKTFVCVNDGGSVIDLMVGHGEVADQVETSWVEKTTELYTGAPQRGHYPVIYSLATQGFKGEKKNVNNYSDTDWDKWTEHLEQELILLSYLLENEITSEEELLKVVNNLNDKIKDTNTIIPKKVICKHSKPFWNHELTKLSKELAECRRKVDRRGTPYNVESFKNKKEEFKKALIETKNIWIRDKLSKLSVTDTKTFWKRYKSLFGDKDSNYIGNLIDGNGKLCCTDASKERVLFDTFFSGQHLSTNTFDRSYEKEVKEIYTHMKNTNFKNEAESTNKITETLGKVGVKVSDRKNSGGTLEEDIINKTISLIEIKEAIKQQKYSGKCSDNQEFNPIMLQYLGPVALSWLQVIFNASLKIGKWPWDTSGVCFLRKENKDSYALPGSYRPITIASYMGKILERVLETRIRKHCDLYDVLDSPQEGFCPEKSTSRYLFKLVSKLHEARRRKLTSMILLIDFQKAFDSVWIPGLILKLYHYGIRGPALALIQNFLTSRKLNLLVNNFSGPVRHPSQDIGLPQGSGLSPLLFIIFIADMLNNNWFHKLGRSKDIGTSVFKFADDGTVASIGKDLQECRDHMQKICYHLKYWCDKWRLLINCETNKTEIVIIKEKRNSGSLRNAVQKVHIGTNEIQYVQKSKVLGVTIDEDLSFEHHGKSVLKSCWNTWYKISRDSRRLHGINAASLTLLFKTLVMTKMLYASTIWLEEQQKLFNDLWSRVLLKISGSEYHTQKEIAELMFNLPPLNQQIEINAVKFMLKGLTSDDEMIATILQIQQEPKHAYHKFVQVTKTYLQWKETRDTSNHPNTNSQMKVNGRRQTSRMVDLLEYVHNEKCKYSKEEMLSFQSHRWRKELQNKIPELKLKKWTGLPSKFLFPRNTLRSENTVIAEFIHGHSLRFQNFCKSVGISDSDICEICNKMADSPEHQLFECNELTNEYREELLKEINYNIIDFKWKIASMGSSKEHERIGKLFISLVKYIDMEYQRLVPEIYL